MRFFRKLDLGIRAARDRLAPLFYRGSAFYCPACHRTARTFKKAGKGRKARDHAVCPFCRARERDRLAILFLEKHPGLFPTRPTALLHVAPEPAVAAFLKARAGEAYLSADIYRPDVMERMDITAIPRPDGSFGAIYCSHVLQDVPDDDRALRELHRVLAPGGWAILNVPYYKGSATTPLDAVVKGGDRPPEFFRDYGDDYPDQLRRAGFIVQEYGAEDLWDFNDPRDPALRHVMTGHVHFCRKPA